MVIGTTYGFVAPGTANPTEDADAGNYSTTGFVLAGTAWDDADTGVAEITLDNLTRSYAFNGTITALLPAWRLVSMGVRVRYIGTEDSMAGQIYLYQTQGNYTAYDTLLLSTIQGAQNVRIEPCDRNWHMITWAPMDSDDTDYVGNLFYPANTTKQEPIVIAVTGTAGQTYAWECVWHWEVVAPGNPGSSKSGSDPIGLAAINAVTNELRETNKIVPPDSFIDKVKDQVANALSQVDPTDYAGVAANQIVPGSGAQVQRFVDWVFKNKH
jgi:hypothetical protein